MEDRIKRDFLGKKTRVVRKEACNHDDRFKACFCKLISLMPWLGLNIDQHNDQGSALQMVKCAMPTVTIKGGDSLGTMMKYRIELHMGGVIALIAKRRIVLVLQVVGRECETINYPTRELCDVGDAHRSRESQGSCTRTGDCTAT